MVKFCPFGGKITYRTRKKALKAAAKSVANAMKTGQRAAKETYQCKNCGFWHLTKGKT